MLTLIWVRLEIRVTVSIRLPVSTERSSVCISQVQGTCLQQEPDFAKNIIYFGASSSIPRRFQHAH